MGTRYWSCQRLLEPHFTGWVGSMKLDGHYQNIYCWVLRLWWRTTLNSHDHDTLDLQRVSSFRFNLQVVHPLKHTSIQSWTCCNRPLFLLMWFRGQLNRGLVSCMTIAPSDGGREARLPIVKVWPTLKRCLAFPFFFFLFNENQKKD